MGINSTTGSDDEVNRTEMLTINFTSSQFVESFTVNRLFQEGCIFIIFCGEDESGRYSINGGAFVDFNANSNTGNFTVNLNQAGVNQIRFDVPGSSAVNDYAVRSVNVTAVPEPASMMLLGTGLLYGARRRYQMKKQKQQ
jgi:hypothetical protein